MGPEATAESSPLGFWLEKPAPGRQTQRAMTTQSSRKAACTAVKLFLALSILALSCFGASSAIPDYRGVQFLGFKDFSKFTSAKGTNAGDVVLTSPEVKTDITWNELVASWNIDLPDGAWLKTEARAIYPDGCSKFYNMGFWAGNTNRHLRESVKHQKDAAGDVDTDTLMLTKPTDRFQIRLTMGGDGPQPKMKFLGVCVADTKTAQPALPPNKAAWGKIIDVPQRAQMNYTNGGVLCSPTTVSMIMTHWSHQLLRPELDHDVPDIVDAIYDPVWKGTGNWPFNTAYAGSYAGMKAYVTRMSDLAEVEDWIAAGFPVGLSVCSDRLHHRGPGPNGHLIVCVGFTKDGDVMVNDPGSTKQVRRVYPRADIIYAWAYSHDAAYIIYPEGSTVPANQWGHWSEEKPGARN